jgi:hypothetical protein
MNKAAVALLARIPQRHLMYINPAFSHANRLQSLQKFGFHDSSLRTAEEEDTPDGTAASAVVEFSESAQGELARLQNRQEETDPPPVAELGLLVAESASDDDVEEAAAKRGIDVGSHDRGVRGLRGLGAERGVRHAYGLRAQLEKSAEEVVEVEVEASPSETVDLPINGEAPIAEQQAKEEAITAADIPPTRDEDEISKPQSSYTAAYSALNSYEQFVAAA